MDFNHTGEQAALADSVRRFCDDNIDLASHRRDGRSPSDTRLWRQIADLGWLGAGLSEEEGGFGGGPVESAIIAEAFGRSLAVEPYVSSAVLSVRTLLASGGSAASLIESIVLGERTVALACCEPEGRGDPSHVSARAERKGGGYRLSGRKSLVLGGANADFHLVSARTSGDVRDDDGVTLFRIERAHPGLRRQDYRLVDRRMACDLWLDDLEVGADAVVGEPDQASGAIREGVDHGIAAICADSLGAMDRALWITRDYLKTRKQFGQTLSSFQALQHRMADMLVELELSRSMLYAALAALALGADKRSRGVSAAKAVIGKAGIFIGQQAIQLHGGIGMTEEYAVGHYYKRLLANASLFGSIDAHIERYAALSGGEPASVLF